MSKKVIPIVVPLFNAVEYTKGFVESVRRNTKPNTYKLILVDNASTDETPEYLKELVASDPDHIVVLTQGTNLGFAGGVNQGLSLISTMDWDYCMVSNNDVLVTPEWLASLTDCIKYSNLPSVGAVAPVSNQAGGSQRINVDYATPTPEIVDDFGRRRKQSVKGLWMESGVLVGLCWMMSREFFDQVGYLDESFGRGQWEDNIILRGVRILVFIDQDILVLLLN